ncbi:UNVERIFIED_CONTAM: hypothetical protein HDU68_008833 [Siphonaria sp. JEL0065]|nr:hypothetical protein HDU68_008833 [Siphonaria sp. JEL0065]
MKISDNSFELDDETVEELRFYLIQIYMILKPVVILFNTGLGSLTQNIYAGGVDGVVAGGTKVKSGEVAGDLTSALITDYRGDHHYLFILIGFFGFIVVGLLGMFGLVLGITLFATTLAVEEEDDDGGSGMKLGLDDFVYCLHVLINVTVAATGSALWAGRGGAGLVYV